MAYVFEDVEENEMARVFRCSAIGCHQDAVVAMRGENHTYVTAFYCKRHEPKARERFTPAKV